MIEKPHLADEKIIAALREHYAIPVTAVEFQQLGNDDSAWVYKVRMEGRKSCFLKVRKGQINEASLIVPRYLKDNGIEQVVAPIPNQSGVLWTAVESFGLILYPYIDGEMGAKIGMTDAQLMELGGIVGKMHSLALSADLLAHLRKETYTPKWISIVQSFLSAFPPRPITNEHEEAFAAIWQDKRDEIEKILNRTQVLSHILQNQALKFVLCHADIHKYNVLIDHDGRLFIVDWDEVIFAPKERDLMFVGGSITHLQERGRETELFYRGYGSTDVDPVAFAYYRYAWGVEEIGSYSERVFLTPDVGEATQAEAIDYFRSLFQPGDVVDVAYETDADLPPEIKALLI